MSDDGKTSLEELKKQEQILAEQVEQDRKNNPIAGKNDAALTKLTEREESIIDRLKRAHGIDRDILQNQLNDIANRREELVKTNASLHVNDQAIGELKDREETLSYSLKQKNDNIASNYVKKDQLAETASARQELESRDNSAILTKDEIALKELKRQAQNLADKSDGQDSSALTITDDLQQKRINKQIAALESKMIAASERENNLQQVQEAIKNEEKAREVQTAPAASPAAPVTGTPIEPKLDPAPAPEPVKEQKIHKIKKGDTLFKIAKNLLKDKQVDCSEHVGHDLDLGVAIIIASKNDLKSFDKIREGKELKLPTSEEITEGLKKLNWNKVENIHYPKGEKYNHLTADYLGDLKPDAANDPNFNSNLKKQHQK